MCNSTRILFVGGDRERVDRVADRLEGRNADLTVQSTARPQRALEAVADGAPDCLLAEYALEGLDGIDLLARVRDRRPDVPVVLFPLEGDEDVAAAAVARGATDYVPHVPDDPTCYDRLVAALEDATGVADERGGSDRHDGAQPIERDGADASVADGVPARSRREERLATLHEATRDLMSAASRVEIGEITVETAKNVLDLPMTSIYFRDGDRLEPVASTDDVRELFGTPPPLERGEALAWDAYEAGEVVSYADVREVDGVKNESTPIRSELHVPLGEHGILLTGSTTVEEYDDSTIEFARLLAANAEAALDRAERESLLRRRERELAESQRQFRQIARAVDSVIWLRDRDGDLVFVNDAFEAVWGRDAETLERDPESFLEAVHPDDSERVRRWHERRPGDADELEYRIEHPTRGRRWVREQRFPIGDETSDGKGTDEKGADEGAEDRVVGIVEDVTQRKERERELERYERVFESVRDRVYVLDDEGRFEMVNEPMASMLGYDREALLGESVRTVIDESSLAGADDGARSPLANGDVEPLLPDADDTATTFELDVRTAADERIPCEIEMARLPGENGAGTVGVVRDVTERERVRAALQLERDRFDVLFENMPDPAVLVEFRDDEPIVQTINDAFEELFGYDADRLRGESLNDHLVPPEEEERVKRLDERALAGEQIQTEVRREASDGRRDFLFRGVTVGDGDRIEGFGIYTDITDQKTRERQLQVLNRVLRHNLRNDMNVIIGYAELLESEITETPIGDPVEGIVDTARNVARIGEKVRTVADALEIDSKETDDGCDAVDLVERTIEPYRQRPDVDLETSLPDRQPVDADERLRPALENVLDNAVEHGSTSSQGDDRPDEPLERTDVDPVAIEISLERREDGFVELVVADDGPGIPEDERRVLEADREISQLEHGSGLGLWIVDWIVTTLGGEVSFETAEGRGTEVRFLVPAADSESVE